MMSYEELRRKNLEENLRILNEMEVPTFVKHMLPKAMPVKMKRTDKSHPVERISRPQKRKRPLSEVDQILNDDSLMDGARRRSSRLSGKRIRYSLADEEHDDKDGAWMPSNDYGYSSEDEDSDGGRKRLKTRPGKLYVNTRPKVDPNRPNFYGEIEGIDIGTMFPSRLDSCAAGIHRPTVAGIHGGPDGAYSIALSGGYEDDVDMGDRFTYTGEGGRDLKGTKDKPKNLRTAPQSCDQKLVRGNLALVRSCETGNPVRVIRGYKLTTKFAPESGYRYDGLYRVEKWWQCTGTAGFKVFKYAMRRLDGQAPPPWIRVDDDDDDVGNKDDQENNHDDDADKSDLEENGNKDDQENNHDDDADKSDEEEDGNKDDQENIHDDSADKSDEEEDKEASE